jgi:putative protease
MGFELNAPAGNLPSLIEACDAGADSVYFGFKSRSNLRMYPGLNFDLEEAEEGIRYLHKHHKRAYITVNTFPLDGQTHDCLNAIDEAWRLGADAVLVSDIGLMQYVKETYPGLRLHVSVFGRPYNAEAVRFYQRFGARRIVLPCLLNMEEIAEIAQSGCEIEVFAAGRVIGINREGCLLNSYFAGWPISSMGSCTPVEYLSWEESGEGSGNETFIRLKGVTIDRIVGAEPIPYPAICMGQYRNLYTQSTHRVFRDSVSMSVLDLLPELRRVGVAALKIEGRQRSKVFVKGMTEVFREAIDSLEGDPEGYKVKDEWRHKVLSFSEGEGIVNGYREKGY